MTSDAPRVRLGPFFGYHISSFTFPGVPAERLFGRVIELAQAAEAAGFGLVTVMDHFYQIRGVGSEEEPMLEAYTALSGIAAQTRRVHVGAMVTGVTYRNPALLAKTVTTLDVVSGGRAMLGLGAAWNEDEHLGYGFDFPPLRERMDRLDEALEVCGRLFREERPSFEGRHYRLTRALNRPRPLQPGGPPIMVGGGGEQRTLRIAARHADLTHWFPLGREVLRHKTEVLARYCEEIGRDPTTIQRTMAAPVVLAADEREAALLREQAGPDGRLNAVTPAQAAEALRPYLDDGFTGFTFRNPQLPTIEGIGLAGELLQLIGWDRAATAQRTATE